jgi:hypothetical protein
MRLDDGLMGSLSTIYPDPAVPAQRLAERHQQDDDMLRGPTQRSPSTEALDLHHCRR